MTITVFVFRLYRVFDLLLMEIREALIVLRGGQPYLPDIITSIHFFKVLGNAAALPSYCSTELPLLRTEREFGNKIRFV